MNNKTVSSLFVLFAIVSIGMTAAPGAFAEHSMNATVENAEGSSVPGCEPDCFIPATVTIGVGGMLHSLTMIQQHIPLQLVLQLMDQVAYGTVH